MSKAFMAAVLQDSLECTGVVANKAAVGLIAAIVRNLKSSLMACGVGVTITRLLLRDVAG